MKNLIRLETHHRVFLFPLPYRLRDNGENQELEGSGFRHKTEVIDDWDIMSTGRNDRQGALLNEKVRYEREEELRCGEGGLDERVTGKVLSEEFTCFGQWAREVKRYCRGGRPFHERERH